MCVLYAYCWKATSQVSASFICKHVIQLSALGNGKHFRVAKRECALFPALVLTKDVSIKSVFANGKKLTRTFIHSEGLLMTLKMWNAPAFWS